MAVFSGPEIPNEGLVTHIDPIRTDSVLSDRVLDISGQGNDLLIFNSLSVTEDISYDAVDDYSYISQPAIDLSSVQKWSLCLWIYPITGTSTSFFVSPLSSGVDHFMIYDASNKRVSFRVTERSDTNSRNMYTPVNTVPLDTWTFLCFNIDDLYRNIYVNGEFSVERTETAFCAPWLGSWYFGTRAIQTARLLGKLSEIKIYNRNLSALEINQTFQATRDRYGI